MSDDTKKHKQVYAEIKEMRHRVRSFLAWTYAISEVAFKPNLDNDK